MLDFLITPAYAQGQAAAQGGGMESLIFMILLFGILYFLLIRPQQKQVKQHKEMVSNLRRGDRVVTQGGIVGQIHRVDDNNEELIVEVGEVEVDNKVRKPVRMRVRRSAIGSVVDKSVPTEGEEKAEEKSEEKSEEKKDDEKSA
uniref:Sec translocon accessory complex subunit YajC n=1 Tax=Magnetococcus massalia (strain MO-1) TaxID=451514 RepID=A0A1S7LPX6_MAGMO|nr:preprotein translocase subunit YajC [Candidatus Magnetococcus massalia]CRH08249.1 preprotein translocase (YajC) [Candidatus Magnetococcus massalia]CRH08316.1 preprotein translocase (YajC) [Candidatus Magnetococcus massalia]